jgi:hypothetical protein
MPSGSSQFSTMMCSTKIPLRAEADERKLDEVLDRLADAGKAADQDDSYPAGVGEDRGPLPPRIDPLFGLLIGALAVLVLIAMLALLSLRS